MGLKLTKLCLKYVELAVCGWAVVVLEKKNFVSFQEYSDSDPYLSSGF